MTEKQIKNILIISEIQSCIFWFQKSIHDIKKRDKNRDLSEFEKRVSMLVDFSARFIEIAEENKILKELLDESQYRLVMCDSEHRKKSIELNNLKKNLVVKDI
jgi:hypothetical protein